MTDLLPDDAAPTTATPDVDTELVENIGALVEAGQEGMVVNLVADLYPADLEQVLSHLPADSADTLFHWLPTEQASEVLPELDDDFRAELLEEATPARLTELLDEMDSDDVADVLADLPEEVAQRVLPMLEDAEDVSNLLSYDEDTAGGLMAREYVAVPWNHTVDQATEEVRRKAEEVDPVYVIYVVDDHAALAGIVTLKRLLLTPSGVLLHDIMDADFVSVNADQDQEEVARLFERYDLLAIPVVDQGGHILGRITIDDVVDVIREEAEEDIQRMSGTADEQPNDSIWEVVRGRITWLYIGLAGALLSGGVIMGFEEELASNIALAFFIPVVMAMAGNAGIQSSAIAVQGIASGDLWTSDVFKRLGKELLVSICTGLLLSLVLAMIVVGLGALGAEFLAETPNVFRLALVVSLSLTLVIILATTLGATIPLLLDRVNIDPALATGPFITTSNDLLGLAIFFLLSATLLG
ncbi:MAG: magnesium transporter [Rhodothermales bacterium]